MNTTARNFDNAYATCENSMLVLKAGWASKKIISCGGMNELVSFNLLSGIN